MAVGFDELAEATEDYALATVDCRFSESEYSSVEFVYG